MNTHKHPIIKDCKTGLAVTLTAISSIACGALLCLGVWIIGRILRYDYDITFYFWAYISSSIGFLLTAPINLLTPILKKNPVNTHTIVVTWSITTLGLLLLAYAVGITFMLIFKWMYDSYEPADMAVQFISGAFLLFISGGIHWLFYRRKRH